MKTFLLGFLLVAFAQSASAANLSINGAGSTFVAPLYTKWFSDYRSVSPDVEFNYQSIGSGGGIRQLTDRTVDFGASDAPMTDEQLSKAPAPVIHIPTVLGAVVLTYNLPEIKDSLRLSGDVVADIFLGKITQWDDAKIKALNPQLSLPNTAILVVHRSDGSGTSSVFTDYLSKVSPEWKQKVSSGTSVNWPTGLGGKGNEGVTGIVKQTAGAIGYVELTYAQTNQLPFAALKNKAGNFVLPSPKTVSNAAASAVKSMPKDFRVSITNADGKDVYPVSSFTYLLVYQNTGAPKAEKLTQFLRWAMKDGQKSAEPLFYAPLPKAMLKAVEARIAEVK